MVDELNFGVSSSRIGDIYENTLNVYGGAPNSTCVAYYYSQYSDMWLPLFDPNVIPYLTLDNNGEITYIFSSPTDFTTLDMKVLGTAATPPEPEPLGITPSMIGAAALVLVDLALLIGYCIVTNPPKT